MKRIFLVVLLFLSFNVLLADNPYKVQILGGFAVPFKKYETGLALTQTYESLKFRPGGSFDYGLKIGYEFNPKVETDLKVHYQISYLTPGASNVDDRFTKLMLQPEVLYILSLKKSVKFKFGGGLSYAINPVFDIDATQIQGGAHNIFYFKNSLGFALSAEHEIYLRKKMNLSFVTGFSFRYNMIKVDHVISDGNPAAIDYFPSGFGNNLKKLNAGGLDISMGVCYHFELAGKNRVYEYE